eukprot:CAMPEP_0175074462 /NCGR_PEP_ID=MMETSP0052_2-20121109/21325_1 /TAXON_ID=51329 ORGANISM="Polytomella parva, Strain SAG 63-3" /NCGR_SAMPLE_ID=MMETSP0052_2 /ASSEMBLY_ACC=CAM_ASM_000194 /LENGTH=47 /DNA_ID= /DNA_START= /DNA_END= /DNA_ORIENTATION=
MPRVEERGGAAGDRGDGSGGVNEAWPLVLGLEEAGVKAWRAEPAGIF